MRMHIAKETEPFVMSAYRQLSVRRASSDKFYYGTDLVTLSDKDVLKLFGAKLMKMSRANILKLSGAGLLQLSSTDVLKLSGVGLIKLSGADLL